jgi:Protein of unknown function (DUF3572)
MPITKRNAINAEAAESLAIQALAFLAQEPERLGRFLAITGVGPEDVRAAAREPGFLTGVLEYLAGDERLLVEFATQLGVDPADIARAGTMLGHGTPERDVP